MKTLKFYPFALIMFLLCSSMIIVPALFQADNYSAMGQQVEKTNLKSSKGPIKGDDDKTLSPYFYVQGAEDGLESLPLKSTSADVNIAGVIASVKVTQVYKNTGDKPIEAIYIFPGSTRSAVYSMKMIIGDRIMIAKIQEKEKARQDYETAKQNGQSATLLEQQRPNVFQMNVANIMPGDEIHVELCYTELLIPEEGIYEFVYPTVVGPRYSNQPEATANADDKWVSTPYTHEGEKPTFTFDFTASINAGMPIRKVACPTHDLVITYQTPTNANLTFKNQGTFEGNRDVILQYKLTEDKIESGLLLYQGTSPEENFFVAMIQPPPRPTQDLIPAREYIFIIDVSGSMHGFPLETSKTLMKDLIGNIRTTDKFNVMLFAGSASVLSPQSEFATKDNLDKALKWIDSQNGGGGTELLPALKQALAIEKAKGFSRTFVIATDGYVSVEKETFDLIRDNLGKANFFAFGIGSSVNRYLIEGIAFAGMGEGFIVTDPSEAAEKAEKFRKYIQSPVLTDVKVKFDGFDVYDIEPINIPDVLAERPVVIYGKWKGDVKGSIKITGISGSSDFSYTINVSGVQPSEKNVALKYLWAREKIRILDDLGGGGENVKKEVTALGLKYNLLTQYTSFIAIDSLVRNDGGSQTTIKHPLPLPQGVSDYAVGSNSGTGMSMQKSGNYPTSPRKSNDKLNVEESSTTPIAEMSSPAYYQGGEYAMQVFIRSNLKMPTEAKTAGITGKVKISFTVEANGEITNIKVINSLGYGCDEEAIRLIKLMKGKWNPKEELGKKTKSTVEIELQF